MFYGKIMENLEIIMRTATLSRSQYYSKGTKNIIQSNFDGTLKSKFEDFKDKVVLVFLIIGMDTK
jgi:hypothetical protein